MAVQLQAAIVDALGGQGQVQVDPIHNALRAAIRPLDHSVGGPVRGHYRGVGISGAVASISAAGIIANFMPPPVTPVQCVVHRIQVCLEVLTAVTTATPVDFQSFAYHGGAITNSSGAGSSLVTPSRLKSTHAPSVIPGTTAAAAAGEFRMIGTTTALTAAGGKSNDASAFGTAMMQILTNVSATGTAVLVTAGNATIPYDIYHYVSPSEHPQVIAGGDGIETQIITANNTTGTVKITLLFAWSELNVYGG